MNEQGSNGALSQAQAAEKKYGKCWGLILALIEFVQALNRGEQEWVGSCMALIADWNEAVHQAHSIAEEQGRIVVQRHSYLEVQDASWKTSGMSDVIQDLRSLNEGKYKGERELYLERMPDLAEMLTVWDSYRHSSVVKMFMALCEVACQVEERLDRPLLLSAAAQIETSRYYGYCQVVRHYPVLVCVNLYNTKLDYEHTRETHAV